MFNMKEYKRAEAIAEEIAKNEFVTGWHIEQFRGELTLHVYIEEISSQIVDKIPTSLTGLKVVLHLATKKVGDNNGSDSGWTVKRG